VTPLYPKKLALTSPTGGSRSVGIVRVRTKATEFLDPYGTAGRQAQLLSKVTPFYRGMFCKLGAKERNIKANELHIFTPADKLVCHCELLCSAVLQAGRTQCRLSNQFSFIAQEANSKQLTYYISQKTRPWNLQLS